ncbi:MAG: peptidase S10 [Pseudomonadota bacterium]|nr:peptidase S10 [Pseudomonadota bacterium]
MNSKLRYLPWPLLLSMSAGGWAAAAPDRTPSGDSPDTKIVAEPSESPRYLHDERRTTQGSMTIGGHILGFQAEAGVLVVHVKDPMDDDAPLPKEERTGPPPPQPPEASMSYVAYFRGEKGDKNDKEDSHRPITFLFNGGPGSSTVWLHMGAFGPKRVVTPDDKHVPAAPYRVVDNEYTLLDVSDLVFVDAPGTGFGHLRGADKEKAFYGVDQDAHAFANFIVEFLSRHNRWNSPKYLFGESYGTTRSAALAYILENEKSLDLNGIILLSQILNFDDSADAPQFNPGVDLPYVLALPTYTATAWYHHKLANQPAELEPLLREVEKFAMTDYAPALAAGSTLERERKSAVAGKLSAYTGLPADYIERANLRVNGGEFEKTLLGSDVTTGRLDTRFAGPTIDPMSKEADYDPQSASISSAYVSAFNDYVRSVLKFGDQKTYKPGIDIEKYWDFQHQPPGAPQKIPATTNVMPDLAVAMKQNPNLKVQLNGGYYDLATPYFAAVYELRQLPLQASLEGNIEMHFYASGHMVYAHEPDLQALHANVARFIEKTKSGPANRVMVETK